MRATEQEALSSLDWTALLHGSLVRATASGLWLHLEATGTQRMVGLMEASDEQPAGSIRGFGPVTLKLKERPLKKGR